MSKQPEASPSLNSWLEEEMYSQFVNGQTSVDDAWAKIFRDPHYGETHNGGAEAHAPRVSSSPATQSNGHPATHAASSAPAAPAPSEAPTYKPTAGEEVEAIRGVAGKIALNMDLSLTVPTATSQRAVPVKVIDENRYFMNQHQVRYGKAKVSYTHLIAWAIVQALKKTPSLNDAYTVVDGVPHRIFRKQINFGIAVDVEGKDGKRSLLVPNIKNVGEMDFAQYLSAFSDMVRRSRSGKLTVDDFANTTISLTNPGTVGTIGSIPRLMVHQGAIIATGTIDYPPEWQGASPEVISQLGLSKVMTMTCTYDHRIIQGAESGMFLGIIHEFLQGGHEFYDHIFRDLGVVSNPVHWARDRQSAGSSLQGGGGRESDIVKQAAVLQLINAYRVRGHLIADLDPLGDAPVHHPELEPSTYGLTIWDLDRQFLTGTLGHREGKTQPIFRTLREILEMLSRAYCGRIGCEYMNIQHPEQKDWLQQSLEPDSAHTPLERNVRLWTLDRLIQAEEFEHFLHNRFVGQKRFSLEGAETAIAILGHLLDVAAADGVHEIVIGMAHRGRLNALANIVGKPLVQIFSAFEGDPDPTSMQGSGDVKYHLGASGTRYGADGKEIVVSIAPNPSHLEAVSPVVEGIVRPKQERLKDVDRERVIPVLLHGDAAFAGQGVVAETLNLSQLPGYTTGGTIHLIINNQIGFTTNPEEARSTPYSTDVARMVQAPIFHVNGDDPDAALRVLNIAFAYRQAFKKDVVIDMFCYRRHGHNEGDDPSYTQPELYRKIKEHPSVATLYGELLTRDGMTTPEQVAQIHKRHVQHLEDAYQAAQQKNSISLSADSLAAPPEEKTEAPPRTSVGRELIEAVVRGMTQLPETFHLHPKLRKFVFRREEIFQADFHIDWATAEALAFGTMVLEGTPVRLSGQDSGRGTFSQRHLVLVDAETSQEYTPLQHLSPDQANFQVWDSSLSEYAVLGYEFGYTIGDPLTLVLWEAQFGDFFNGAQIMIDQFITCSMQKWSQPSSLVMLLPHGYEGQGPEHSSARIERFLILCAEDNIQVVNCSTPAQYFHVLRRQMYGGKQGAAMEMPLVIFTPKSLLRHPQAISTLDEFTGGSFREVIGEVEPVAAENVRRILMCSGKVYYDLIAYRKEQGLDNVAIVRVEQIYPYPERQIRDLIHRYPLTAEVVWVQEEPRNMGAWGFMRERLDELLAESGRNVYYMGRKPSASPATGSHKRHIQEQTELVEGSMAEATFSTGKKARPLSRKRAPA
ncbi:MAG: multifunctional oxoglutarate decarboxylase/oxoglutarate dehydrogenase thiamine pyrophosphate-binding subunit/dihydrolipoyllysine-residue succinyltransferase subunit [Bryobacterales bacterium]|nr:multifunctional oxoglutarate decarboxylase/oxoglutarate dehydrogenase thiamine pyrophosphate-binding subunit/dihydrolipoyllysine-residue succinyltransferase subunit [Bryobacterales bacterium]